jgi:integrase
MGLGTYPEMGLAQARRDAMEARALLAQKIDPIEHRNAAVPELADTDTTPTFAQAVQQVFASISPGFRNAKHRAQWINTLETYAVPHIGSKRVDQLTTADIARVLHPIWLSKPETAGRVKQRCDRVMTWCVANEFATTNPVSSVSALLPKQKSKADRVVNFPAVAWRNLPPVCAQLFPFKSKSMGREALQFLILTAARSGEVRGAKWSEFDFGTRVWAIPAARMKANRPHRIPLSGQAIAVLERRAQTSLGGDLVFSVRTGKPISDMTLTKVLRDHKVPSDVDGRIATAHGFRSSFRDWASENGYPRDFAERALAHTIKNATEAAYHRTDQLEQRRDMMQAWADFVSNVDS